MKALLQAALAALTAITFLPGDLWGQEKADETKKTVRLVWFPRFSPDGKWLASAHGSWDQKEAGEVRLWNAETGKNTFVLEHPRGVRSVAWSPKGRRMSFNATLMSGKSISEAQRAERQQAQRLVRQESCRARPLDRGPRPPGCRHSRAQWSR